MTLSVVVDRIEVWQAVSRLLEEVVPSHLYHAWIEPLRVVEINQDGLKIQVEVVAPNDFTAQWVRDHYQKQIHTAFQQILGECQLSFSIANPGSEEIVEKVIETKVADVVPPQEERRSSSVHKPSSDQPDSRYHFENFVVGGSNQFAHASAFAVAEHPGKQYNPLFLFSPPGLGKTHLLHAIGNRLLQKNTQARVAYLSAEKFVNELIDSLQHRRMSQFRAKYRDSFDMILIDDIQFIAGKNTSEEEFFHTFNALHGSKRQIVMTSDRPPKEIQGLAERVRTRFEWGLVADISPPEIETRIAILKTKAETDDIYLPDDVAAYIASCIKSNVRELEGVLIRLQAQASLTGSEISLEMTKQELKSAALSLEAPHFTAEAIQNAVIKYYRIKLQDLKSATRARSVAHPRQIAMYLIRKYTGKGFKEIGSYFGGKDHTTVLYACNKIDSSLEKDKIIRTDIEAIQSLL